MSRAPGDPTTTPGKPSGRKIWRSTRPLGSQVQRCRWSTINGDRDLHRWVTLGGLRPFPNALQSEHTSPPACILVRPAVWQGVATKRRSSFAPTSICVD